MSNNPNSGNFWTALQPVNGLIYQLPSLLFTQLTYDAFPAQIFWKSLIIFVVVVQNLNSVLAIQIVPFSFYQISSH